MGNGRPVLFLSPKITQVPDRRVGPVSVEMIRKRVKEEVEGKTNHGYAHKISKYVLYYILKVTLLGLQVSTEIT